MAKNIMHECRACGNEFKRSRPDQNSEHYCSLACRFWSKVDKSAGVDACWPWTAKSKHKAGYGVISVDGKRNVSHRVAWELARGEIPPGMHVCHKCDNPPCCNPSHYFLGTPADNVLDMVDKGRHGTKGKKLPEWWKEKLRKPKTITTPRTPELMREITTKGWATRRARADLMRGT